MIRCYTNAKVRRLLKELESTPSKTGEKPRPSSYFVIASPMSSRSTYPRRRLKSSEFHPNYYSKAMLILSQFHINL